MHLVSANVSTTKPLVVGAPIELAFDRLLMPSAVLRQSILLQDLQGNYLSPSESYDPVSRVVRLCVTGLQPDLSYRITLASPGDAADPNGVRAIDGALLDPTQPTVIEFPVVAPSAAHPAYTGYDACDAPTKIDFCKEVLPVFQNKCNGGSCHVGSLPAAGLLMTTPAGIRETAINRVAQGSNTGPRATSSPASQPFGVDMPIIDTSTAPGDSWLVYKLLLAAPGCSATPPVAPCDAGVPGPQNQRLAVPWSVLADSERQTLSDWVLGREMPFPADPAAAPGTAPDPLTADQMETVSLWILQGAAVPDCP